MKHLIYVFDTESKDALLALDFTLLKENEEAGLFVFLNSAERDIACANVKYVLSDCLTF